MGNKRKKQIKINNKAIMVVIIFIVTFIPFIIKLRVDFLEGFRSEFRFGNPSYSDLFNYAKMEVMVFFTVVLFVLYIYNMYKNKESLKVFSSNKFNIILFILIAIMLLITVLSEYKRTSLIGSVGRYEGMYAFLAYFVICIIIINTQFSFKNIRTVFFCITIAGTIMGLIGIGQYYGYDIINTNLIKSTILGKKYLYLLDTFKFTFDKGIIYGTLYNPNYVGSYCALVLPVSIGYYLYEKRKLWSIIAGLIFNGFIFFLLIGSKSTTGYISFIAGMIILLIVVIIKYRNILSKLLILLMYFFLIYQLVNISSLGKINNEFEVLSSVSAEINTNKVYFNEVIFEEKSIFFDTNQGKVRLHFLDNKQVSFTDENDEVLMIGKSDKIVFDKEELKNLEFIISIDEEGEIMIGIAGNVMRLKIEDGIVKHYKTNDKTYYQEFPDKFTLIKNVNMFSSRGYIWKYSIPLLKKNILLGKGPDTFVYYFPQNEVAEKLNAMNDNNKLVDKPHNMFIQYGVNHGVLFLLIYLLLLGLFMFRSFKIIFRNKNSNIKIFLISIMISIISYLIAGIGNDSIVGVSLIMWVLLGFGINIIVKWEKYDNNTGAQNR
jgi:hypothetical protein